MPTSPRLDSPPGDPRPPLWVYLHISKCAGSSVRTMIEHNCSPRECLLLGSRESKAFRTRPRVEMVRTLAGADMDRIRVIHGHGTYFGIHEEFPHREPRYVLFLRDPVARVLSNYRYRLRQRADQGEATRPTADGGRSKAQRDFRDIDDVEAWLGSNDQARDFMTRSLLARVVDVAPDVSPVRTTSAVVSPERVEQVKAALARFYFVGMVENAEDFLFLYGKMRMRWSTPRQKVSRSDGPDLRDHGPRVEALNRADRAVYEHATMLNERFKATHPEFSDVVRATRAAHDRLAPLHTLAFRSRGYLSRRLKRFNRLRP